jgi:hypothetical protein
MVRVFVLVDQYGFIGAFSTLNKAKTYGMKMNIKTLIKSYPLDDSEDLKKVYFLPHVESNSVEFVTNNKDLYLSVQKLYLELNMGYPDHINFFTRDIDVVEKIDSERTKNVNDYADQTFEQYTNKFTDLKPEHVDTGILHYLVDLDHNDVTDLDLSQDSDHVLPHSPLPNVSDTTLGCNQGSLHQSYTSQGSDHEQQDPVVVEVEQP